MWIDGAFGELHTTSIESSGDTVVLVLPALGWDALHSHHSLRVLADSLARVGYPTLRFQYPGTGDSSELPRQGEISPSHWTAWQDSVQAAVDWLRTATGAARVVIAGLRLGATLALTASLRPDIAGLILMAPVLRGRSYIRQMAVEAQMENGQHVELGGGLEFMELDFSASTVREISAVDMRQARPRKGLPIAIFQQMEARLITDCVKEWAAAGANVTQHPFNGLEAMLLQNIDRDPPPADVSAVIGWISRVLPPTRLNHPIALPFDGARTAETYLERAFRFGPGEQMSGVLCQPTAPAKGPLVLIVNTGRDPRYGVARFGVEFARYLADAGVASFRFDFVGLGDSIGPRGWEDKLSSLFDADRSNDISAAADALQPFGYTKFALHGLCSGAYHALRGAIADSRVESLLLVNFPAFDAKSVYRPSATTYYLKRMRLNYTWTRLFRGEIQVRRLALSFLQRHYDGFKLWFTTRNTASARSIAYKTMTMLARRGVRTQFLFAAGDDGLKATEEIFGSPKLGVSVFNGATLRIDAEIDHVLTNSKMRRHAANIMIDFLFATDDQRPGG